MSYSRKFAHLWHIAFVIQIKTNTEVKSEYLKVKGQGTYSMTCVKQNLLTHSHNSYPLSP